MKKSRIIGISLALLGALFIFVIPSDEANAVKLLGFVLGASGLLVATYPHQKTVKPSLDEKMRGWAEERGFTSIYSDEEVMNYKDDRVHIHYNIPKQKLKIYADEGKQLVFTGRLNYIGQLDNLLEMIY